MPGGIDVWFARSSEKTDEYMGRRGSNKIYLDIYNYDSFGELICVRRDNKNKPPISLQADNIKIALPSKESWESGRVKLTKVLGSESRFVFGEGDEDSYSLNIGESMAITVKGSEEVRVRITNISTN